MFNIDKLHDTYSWHIAMKVPNNGQFDTIKIKVLYKRLPHDQRVELLEQLQAAGDDASVSQALENDFFDKVFAGWEKGQIKTDEGELENNDDNRAAVLGISEFRIALVEGFFASLGGDAGKHNVLKA